MDRSEIQEAHEAFIMINDAAIVRIVATVVFVFLAFWIYRIYTYRKRFIIISGRGTVRWSVQRILKNLLVLVFTERKIGT
jgi:hypothetical protein